MRRILLPLLLALPSVLSAGGGGTLVAKGQRFMVEVASTPKEEQLGLMYRKELAKDRCMFFIYQEDGYHTIWMKNCLIYLDVAWIDSDGRIVELVPDVPPPSPMHAYASDADYPQFGGKVASRHFIEFPVGTFKRLGLKLGDRLGWDLQLDDGSTVKGGVPVPAEKKRKK